MRIDILIDKLMELQKLYPEAVVYFTDEIYSGTMETYFESFNIDDEANEIEMKFSNIVENSELSVYHVGFNGNDETEVDAATEEEAIELAKVVAKEDGVGFELDYVEKKEKRT